MYMFLRLNVSGLMHLKISRTACSTTAELVRNIPAALKSSDSGQGFTTEDCDTESCGDLEDNLASIFQQINRGMIVESKTALLCIISPIVFLDNIHAAGDIDASP
jgi:hypothetical protein